MKVHKTAYNPASA